MTSVGRDRHVGHCGRGLVVMASVGAAVGQHAVILDLEMGAVELALLLIGAVDGLGDRDVARLHLVAVHLDGAEQIRVMRAGVALLAVDGVQVVVGAGFVVGVYICVRLVIGGGVGDFD